jgi:ABC-type nitrate/sulfonate/bicarbonate transport system permease component
VLSVLVEDRSGDIDDDAEDQLDFTAERRARRRRRARHLAMSAAGLALAAALWEIAALIINDATFLPTVQATVSTFSTTSASPTPPRATPCGRTSWSARNAS